MDIKEVLKSITPEKLDAMSFDERAKIQTLINELKERKKDFPIMDFKFLPHQQEIADAIAKRNEDGTPYYKFVVMIGGNGAGKTITGGNIISKIALGKEGAEKYGYEFIGEGKKIKIATSTSSQIIDNLEPYILGTNSNGGEFLGDLTKIPPIELSGKPRREKDILKVIRLKNGATITFGTYAQGQANLQGGSPDFTWLDEVPERWDDFRELIRGTRNVNAQFLITFTPTNFNQNIYNWIYGEDDGSKDDTYGKGRKLVIQVDSLQNTLADHSWMKGLSEEELQIVRFGKFVPPTGLVFKSFNRINNTIQHFNPYELEGEIKFYGALDFGVKHPMAFLFIAVDSDKNVYIFDMIYETNLLLKDLMTKVEDKKKEYGINFEWIVADSADKRARIELKEMGMRTIPADKRSKGESNMSNRRTGIMKLNQMFALGEITISDKCKELIHELEVHHYKENGVDGTVEKTEDDALRTGRFKVFYIQL